MNKLTDWKRSAIFTQERSQEGEMRGFMYACMSRILYAAKHSWTTLHMSRALFVGSYFAGHFVGFPPMKRDINLHLMRKRIIIE